MKSFRLIAIFSAFIGILFTSCASVAHVEKDETVNFSQYKTFAWVETSATKEMTDNKVSDLTERNIKNAIKTELEKEGWREVNNRPDVLLSYDVLVERAVKEQSNAVYSQPYTRWFFNPYARRWVRVFYPSQYLGNDINEVDVKEGTITVSMFDAKTDKTVWQGWTTNTVNSNNLTSKEIQNSVKSIFRKFDTAKR